MDQSHRLTLELEDRQRILARIVALIEGRGVEIRSVRYAPPGSRRVLTSCVIEIRCPDDRLAPVVDRLLQVPGVRGVQTAAPAVPL